MLQRSRAETYISILDVSDHVPSNPFLVFTKTSKLPANITAMQRRAAQQMHPIQWAHEKGNCFSTIKLGWKRLRSEKKFQSEILTRIEKGEAEIQPLILVGQKFRKGS